VVDQRQQNDNNNQHYGQHTGSTASTYLLTYYTGQPEVKSQPHTRKPTKAAIQPTNMAAESK